MKVGHNDREHFLQNYSESLPRYVFNKLYPQHILPLAFSIFVTVCLQAVLSQTCSISKQIMSPKCHILNKLCLEHVVPTTSSVSKHFLSPTCFLSPKFYISNNLCLHHVLSPKYLIDMLCLKYVLLHQTLSQICSNSTIVCLHQILSLKSSIHNTFYFQHVLSPLSSSSSLFCLPEVLSPTRSTSMMFYHQHVLSS